MCRLAPPDFTRAVAYSIFEEEMREMLHLLKYERVVRLASGQLGEWMAAAMLQLAAEAGPELMVIAVPLFGVRERKRGFNQSVLLADAAIAKLSKLRPEWKLTARHAALTRVRDTDAQFGLSAHQRRKNLRGAFRVMGDVRGREVLLVDDVMTTGATARECARVLVKAGAAKVWVATLARAQAEGMVGAVWDAVAQSGIAVSWGDSLLE
jgi:ComF family protein